MVAIVIVNFNNLQDLKSCLGSVYKSSYKNFKVVVVDNGSSDKSVEYVEKHFPKIFLIETKKNNGYARGNNIGMKFALGKLKASHILLLNPDTLMDKDCLKELTKKKNDNAILQPLLLLYENHKKTNLVNTAGNVLNYLGFSYVGDYRKKAEAFQKDKDSALCSGACMFLPKKILQRIGFLDESFFMYHEDADLSWRARIYGFNIKTIVKAIVWHKYSFSRNKKKMFFAERNRLAFTLKNYSFKTLLLISPVALLNESSVCSFALKEKWLSLKIKSYFSGMLMLPHIFSERKQIQKKRKVSDQTLSKYLSDEISFSEIKLPLPAKAYNYIIKSYWNLIKKII